MVGRWERSAACALVTAAWIALAFLGASVYSPPTPRPRDIPDTEFSAGRARVILQELVGDGIPHPSFSQQNDVVRERILRRLRDYGYEPEVQVTHTDGRNRLVARPLYRNVLVRRRGKEAGNAVMLVGHYDSVGRGPGASDDGVAVAAILEIARMLRNRPATRNDIILLITDGEEEGLMGARGFVREHPWTKDVKLALNFEARGTSGPSLMFETSEDSAWLISIFARHITRPTTSSLYYEFYKRLQNDTDFTIFKQRGYEGYNFAFVRYVQNYHTKNDDFAHADPGSLQHQGQNAWQLLTALADLDLGTRTGGRAIYTDVLAMFVVWWPASINLPLSVLTLVLTLAAFVVARVRGWCAGFKFRVFLVIAMPLAAGTALAGFIGIGGSLAVPNALPAIVACWGLPLLAAFGVCRLTPLGRADDWSAWAGSWFTFNAIGVAVAWFAPGASFLFLLPGLTAALTGLVASLLPRWEFGPGLLAAICLGSIAAGVLWIPMQVLLYDGVGFLFPVYPVCGALAAITFVPLLARGLKTESLAPIPEAAAAN